MSDFCCVYSQFFITVFNNFNSRFIPIMSSTKEEGNKGQSSTELANLIKNNEGGVRPKSSPSIPITIKPGLYSFMLLYGLAFLDGCDLRMFTAAFRALQTDLGFPPTILGNCKKRKHVFCPPRPSK